MTDPTEPTRPPTLGEYRVGIDFNPSGDPLVALLKIKAAAIIDTVDAIPDLDEGEIRRLKALAMTHFEEGAMNAVKAATKKVRP